MASGIDGKSCYYRGAYDGGALFFLVKQVPESLLTPVTIERAITVISEVISAFDVPHKAMVTAFLMSQQFHLESIGNKLSGNRNGDRIELTFDDLNRLVNIEANLSSRTAD